MDHSVEQWKEKKKPLRVRWPWGQVLILFDTGCMMLGKPRHSSGSRFPFLPNQTNDKTAVGECLSGMWSDATNWCPSYSRRIDCIITCFVDVMEQWLKKGLLQGVACGDGQGVGWAGLK